MAQPAKALSGGCSQRPTWSRRRGQRVSEAQADLQLDRAAGQSAVRTSEVGVFYVCIDVAELEGDQVQLIVGDTGRSAEIARGDETLVSVIRAGIAEVCDGSRGADGGGTGNGSDRLQARAADFGGSCCFLDRNFDSDSLWVRGAFRELLGSDRKTFARMMRG